MRVFLRQGPQQFKSGFSACYATDVYMGVMRGYRVQLFRLPHYVEQRAIV